MANSGLTSEYNDYTNNPLYSNKPRKPPNNSLVNQYNLYGRAVRTGENDYNSIMQAYRDMLARGSGNINISEYRPEGISSKPYGAPEEYSPLAQGRPGVYNSPDMQAPGVFKPQTLNAPQSYAPGQYGKPEGVSPLTNQYKQSGDLTDSIRNLKTLSETGGYSAEGVADLRERGISPIRSVYAGANRDIDRQRALSGATGTAGYGALKAKMAREQSDKIGGMVTNVNAGIAQNVASNRLAIAPTYAGVTGEQSNLENRTREGNTSILNSAAYRNAGENTRVNEANIDRSNEANLFNIGRSDNINRENADRTDKGNLFNLGRTDDFNSRQFDENKFADLFNLGKTDEFNRGNVDDRNKANMFNIGRRDDVSRANTDNANKTNERNVDERNRARQINMEIPFKKNAVDNQGNNQMMQILDSMRSLFSSAPGMANLFGSQANNAASLQNNINQQNNDNGMQLIQQLMQVLGGGR